VIRCRTRPGENLAATPHFWSGIHNLVEFGHVEQSRAAAGQQDPAGIDQLHREAIEVKIFVSSLFDFRSTPNQFRGIQDHDIKPLFISQHVSHIAKDFGLDKIDFHLIEIRIFTGEDDSFFIEFHAGHFGRLTKSFGLQGKATGVTAKVEDRFSAAVLGQLPPIVSLVTVKARFVTAGKIDTKPRPMFDHRRLGRDLG